MHVDTIVKGQFEVTDHYELSHGVFVVGHICDGVFREGMKVPTGQDPAFLTVSVIEYVDNLAKGKFWNALAFRERPTLEFVKSVFPVGAVLEAEESAS